MKKIIYIVIILLLVIVGGSFLIKNEEEVTEDVKTTTKSGEVVEVSLEQMAFDGPALIKILDTEGDLATIAIPSMGIQLCAARDNIADVSSVAVGDKVAVSGYVDDDGNIVPCISASHYLSVAGFMGDAVYGYEFSYRKGPNGYITLEDNESTHPDYVTGVVLFNKKEYELFTASTEAREGPPAMHARIYRNDDNLQAPVWALRHPFESNIKLAIGETEETVVGGANAEFYVVDGLYPIDTYIVANGDYIYVLMGAYLDRESAMYKDFQTLVSSFTFTPVLNGAPQGKIDPRVPCESALAYMTFPSGEEADAFVEACINGEHPDVIERYIKEMGFDGKTI